MNSIRFSKWFILCFLIISVAFSACQKDESVKSLDSTKPAITADSASALSISNTPGNSLAAKGILKITIVDSTYTFDAATDSIAFINVNSGDNKYFGITAINKAHTMSFGISSVGLAAVNAKGKVAGSQFLFTVGEKKSLLQYTLTRFADKDDTGNIILESYNKENIIAKGTFVTYLANDDKETSPFYRAEGSFELLLK